MQNEEIFLANYTDGLSDVNLDLLVEKFLQSKGLACFVSVKPKASFHMVTVDEEVLLRASSLSRNREPASMVDFSYCGAKSFSTCERGMNS